MSHDNEKTGREHWLMAEALLKNLNEAAKGITGSEADDITKLEFAEALAPITIGTALRALAHAQLATAAPAYAFHQNAAAPTADSPNIRPGENEAPVPYRDDAERARHQALLGGIR